MRVRLLATAVLSTVAAGVISAAPAVAAPADEDPSVGSVAPAFVNDGHLHRPKYVITPVGSEDLQGRLPTCYRDFYATPSAKICS
ncbi:hypothetical protein ACFVYR_07680 [Streptomyces sp. NPDC058284]|uniref:hypothetical protein n=1 Tax=unclassified Streptomyces TaxID=2593676 RepID=UPI00365C2D01